MKRSRPLLAIFVGAVSAAVISVLAIGVGAGTPDELLPDLRPIPPENLVVVDEGGTYFLGFNSSTQNIGAGRLELRAHRSSAQQPTMTVDQIVHRADGSTRAVTDAGVIQYVFEEDHRHWHWLDFMRYELRTLETFRSLGRDEKSGFCVADRRRVPGFKRPQLFPDPSWCEQDNPNATELSMGLSVGWDDPYEAVLEGQQIPISGVPAGRYYLVHRANPDGKLAETDLANNLSAIVVSITWPDGGENPPAVKQVRYCHITGSEGRDVLRDTEVKGEGICALTGADTIHVRKGFRDVALGGPGNDRFIVGLRDATLDGGAGIDTADYRRLSRSLVVRLKRGRALPKDRRAGFDNLVSVENVRGSRRGDTLVGDAARNSLWGGPGRDRLTGGPGRDLLNGGAGSDRIIARDGHRDRVICGRGDDTVIADRRDVVSRDCETVLRA